MDKAGSKRPRRLRIVSIVSAMTLLIGVLSMAITTTLEPVSATGNQTSNGYWLVASDGGIFNYGDASFYGSAGAISLNKPVVGMASTPSGHGYWLVASDGGIFNYGDASFYGSAGAVHLNRPVVAISVTPPVTTTPPTTTTTTSSTTTSTSTTTTTAPVGTANYLNADTQGIEGSVGGWITWFNSTLSRSTLEAKAGVASLRVDMTDQFWGAELSSPGFASIPGNKRISFWAKQGSVGSGGVIMTVYWLDSGAVGLQTDTVNIPALSASWQQATSDVVAPAGTQSVVVQFFSTDGANGKTAYLDEIYVADRP